MEFSEIFQEIGNYLKWVQGRGGGGVFEMGRGFNLSMNYVKERYTSFIKSYEYLHKLTSQVEKPWS